MKSKLRGAVLFVLLLFSLLFLSAASPPFLRKEVTVFLDEEALPGKEVRIDVFHALRAKQRGGYEKLYDELIKSYSPKEALNYLAVGLGDYLSAECERRRVDPLDATLEWTKKLSSPFIYYADRKGREADLFTVGKLVARAMDQNDTRAEAHTYTHETSARTGLEELKSSTREIARFSTDFKTSGPLHAVHDNKRLESNI